jgi:hypothetical protein
MQQKSDTFLDFLRRTDSLALQLGKRVEDLPPILNISRASMFGYRAGDRSITNRAWLKLESAERAARLMADEQALKKQASERADALVEEERQLTNQANTRATALLKEAGNKSAEQTVYKRMQLNPLYARTPALTEFDAIEKYLRPWQELALRNPNVAPVVLAVLKKHLPYEDLKLHEID